MNLAELKQFFWLPRDKSHFHIILKEFDRFQVRKRQDLGVVFTGHSTLSIQGNYSDSFKPSKWGWGVGPL